MGRAAKTPAPANRKSARPLRTDAERKTISSRQPAAVCRFRSLRHARQLPLHRTLRASRRAHSTARVACSHAGNQTRREVSEARPVKKISRRAAPAANLRSVSVKNYILDTNVLLHDPNSILNFQENTVLIPIDVIEEIDRFKREPSELGQNARSVSRCLDELRVKGRLSEGVPLSNGGRLRIIFPERGANGTLNFGNNTVDSRILTLALNVYKVNPDVPTILVTKDINLRIKADALGLQAEDYETDRVLIKDLYTGIFDLQVSTEKMAAFRAKGELELEAPRSPNEYCTLTEDVNAKRTALTKVDATGKRLVPILDAREGIWGINPRNREQHFALDALLDGRVKLVTLMGKAGTGKTLLAMAAGLKRTVVDREFRRLVVARP